MTKGAQTREMILARTAPLFNRMGYFGASLADIMRATGLEKGGIYNHFASKDDLALAAFDYSVGLVRQRFADALAGKRLAAERLRAIIGVLRDMVVNPPVAGGCPLLNTAIEADDAHPALRARARATMDEWCEMVQRVVTKGVERGELRAGTDPAAVATMLLATLEGAIMISRLRDDARHLAYVEKHLDWYINSLLAPSDEPVAVS